jgi:hypothetical protein
MVTALHFCRNSVLLLILLLLAVPSRSAASCSHWLLRSPSCIPTPVALLATPLAPGALQGGDASPGVMDTDEGAPPERHPEAAAAAAAAAAAPVAGPEVGMGEGGEGDGLILSTGILSTLGLLTARLLERMYLFLCATATLLQAAAKQDVQCHAHPLLMRLLLVLAARLHPSFGAAGRWHIPQGDGAGCWAAAS